MNACAAFFAAVSCPALAQTITAPQPSCAAEDFSFKSRACLEAVRLAKPSLALRGALIAGFGQWRNNPEVFHQQKSEFAHRLAVFYARHAAQDAGELIAGYLNHEDPRPHLSQEHGVWNRTRSALLSVVQTKDTDGNMRIALAPVAGAFGSGMVGAAFYSRNNTAATGFERTGIVYGGYFARAVFREFKPDLSHFAYRLLRQKRP
jgi:hypothetical protein